MAEVTAKQLASIFPSSRDSDRRRYAYFLSEAMEAFGITSTRARAAFLAQVGAESGQLKHYVENLNYSANRLRAVFPKYFTTDAIAKEYAHNPERIANRVYANRLGNGAETTGDGWKYRGRGLIQVTGRENYRHIGNVMATAINFEKNSEAMELPRYACFSAAAFFADKGLITLSEKLQGAQEDEVFKTICKRVNGGLNGYKERLQFYRNAKKVLA